MISAAFFVQGEALHTLHETMTSSAISQSVSIKSTLIPRIGLLFFLALNGRVLANLQRFRLPVRLPGPYEVLHQDQREK
jgi:hypothetical protein